jgi:hypothetical protein
MRARQSPDGAASTRASVPECGALVISIDTELAWGCFDRPDREARWKLEERSREAIEGVLGLFARYEVPATWALVGHLFLRECARVDGCAHPDLPRPAYSWFSDDWLRFDPGTDAAAAPLWYAPDLIDRLLAARPAQEIASHSFSHLLFADPGCSATVAAADLDACVAAAQPWGVPLRSFVFPRNRVAHLDLLAARGFTAYRGRDPVWWEGLRGPVRRAAHYVDDLLALPPPTVTARPEGPLWNLPGSMMLQGLDGLRGLIPPASRVRKGVAGLRRAARRREVFHLWFHPINFAVRCDAMLRVLEAILAEAARLRDAGRLRIRTMAGLIGESEHSAIRNAVTHSVPTNRANPLA